MDIIGMLDWRREYWTEAEREMDRMGVHYNDIVRFSGVDMSSAMCVLSKAFCRCIRHEDVLRVRSAVRLILVDKGWQGGNDDLQRWWDEYDSYAHMDKVA